MRILTVIFTLFFVSFGLNAAFLQLPTSAEIAACSNIAILGSGPATIFYNPALFSENTSFSTSFHTLFSISGLSHKNICGNFNLKKLNFALGLQDFGNDLYKEQTVIVSSNYKVIHNLTIGLSARYLKKTVIHFSNSATMQFDLGANAKFGRFQIFSSFLNFTFMDLEGETLPMENRTGICYNHSEKLKIATSVVKELDYPFSIHFGVSYSPIKRVWLLSGFQNEPDVFSTGIKLNLFHFNFSYGIKTYKILNPTHYISISYDF